MFGAIKNGAIDYWLRTVSLEICFCDIYKINKDSLPEYVIRWSGSEWGGDSLPEYVIRWSGIE